MEYNNYLGWIYPKTKDIVSIEDVQDIIQLQAGQAGGLATLDGAGKVPSDQLPSYVDDVLEFDTIDDFPSNGQSDKIYVDTQTNLTYRWSGSSYILIGGLKNLVDGSENGSIRHIYAEPEDGNYSLGISAVAIGEVSKASGNYSFAEGYNTTASGLDSHAEGYKTTASNYESHAEGDETTASGNSSHAEGINTTASGDSSHAEGSITTASGSHSHAEGASTTASGNSSHAEGWDTIASGAYSHASGRGTKAITMLQTVIGSYNVTDTSKGSEVSKGKYAFIIGNGTDVDHPSNALAVDWEGNVESDGDITDGSGNILSNKQDALVSGTNIKTINNQSLLGSGNISISGGSGLQNLVDGSSISSLRSVGSTEEDSSYTLGSYAFTEGYGTKASGYASHAEGYETEASGFVSHAEGYGTEASNDYSHSEGYETIASEDCSHAEGDETEASGFASHAEGGETIASGSDSHAEGGQTTASGSRSHAEGYNTTASGNSSHAEGSSTTASGQSSHAGGYYTTAQRKSQTAIGEYNILDTTGSTTTRGKYAFIIGNGTATYARSNAFTVDWNGNVESAGTPTLPNHLATKSYVDANIIDLETEIQSIPSPNVFYNYTYNSLTDTWTTDFTFNNIKQAMDANKIVYIKQTYTDSGITRFTQWRILEYSQDSTSYTVSTGGSGGDIDFIATDPDAYMRFTT